MRLKQSVVLVTLKNDGYIGACTFMPIWSKHFFKVHSCSQELRVQVVVLLSFYDYNPKILCTSLT